MPRFCRATSEIDRAGGRIVPTWALLISALRAAPVWLATTVLMLAVPAVAIDPPKALVNVNARPWADVLIDSEMVGQTPLSGISLTVGPHQVVFRNPQFGERTGDLLRLIKRHAGLEGGEERRLAGE